MKTTLKLEDITFKQGIAIVEIYGKYGAIMVGGKEIIPPVYDALSEFKDGYAVAKWKDEERLVNLSGQIRVMKDDKEIFLPEEYDWGFDFVEDICVVIKNDKYGIIDQNFNVKHECEYDSFSNFHNGYGVFTKYRWSEWSDNVWTDNFLVDIDGKENYKIIESFSDGHKIVCSVDNQQTTYGVINSNMEIIIPVIYGRIQRLKNDLYVADSKENTKLFLHPVSGDIISEKVVDYIIDLSKEFFCTFREDEIQNKSETCIYTSPESPQLCIPSQIHVESVEEGNIIFECNNLKYKFDSVGNLYLIAKKTYYGSESWMYRWDKIIERKVKYGYLDYNHKPFSEKYEIIEDNQNKKGLSDLEGNVVFLPQYIEIHPFSEQMFIVSILPDGSSTPKFGVVDVFNNIKIPFIFNYLIPINDKYLAYTDNELNIRENYKLSLPSTFTYTDIRFGITDIRGKKITKSIFSQIIQNIDNSVFIIREDSGVGLINSKGQYILNPKYSSIGYNKQAGTFTTRIHYSELGNHPFEDRTNNVSLDGCYIVKNHIGEIVKVPSQIVDWCGNFSEDGIACVIKNGYSGHMNELYQILSFMNDKKIIMPSEYDFIRNFKYGYAPVSLNGKYGILDTNLKLSIPCEYEYIEALSDYIFKFRKGNYWGVIDKSRRLVAEEDYINITYETEALLRVESQVQNGSIIEYRHGFLDRQGKVIVPSQCEETKRIELGKNIFFITGIRWDQMGVFDKNGNIIVPFIYSQISAEGSLFYCYSGNISSVYNLEGEHMLYIDDKQYVTIPSEYECAQYVGCGLIKVSKAGKWGLIDFFGQIIVETKFTNIDKFDGSFARVGVYWDDEKLRYGLIDTSGEIVLPVEYEEIERWDNGYYIVRKNGLYGLLSQTLHVNIEPSKEYLKKLDDKYIIAKERSEFSTAYLNGLIDYYGNEIISAYEDFSEIIVLENGFLKVIYDRSQYKGFSSIGILNIKGKEVYRNNECDDITYIGNGLLLIKRYAGNDTYNIANLQGKVLFNTYYDYIKILENGNFLINKNRCYGMAKNTGKIFVHPQYTNEIKFENGFAEIKINDGGPTHKINENGQVIVSDKDKNEIILPKEYYWGTDFINGISIVRSIKNDKLGVVNEQCNVVIAPEYDAIDFLSDNTFQVMKKNNSEEYYYGLYDIYGNCIFPAIFTEMKYLDKNRIRVIWNLNETLSWSPGKHTPGPNKYLGDDADYLVNNRSALCDAKGNIISDKNLAYVGEFQDGYAKSYLTTCIENYRAILKQSGIIDINGETIVPSEYDRINLYAHNFALLRKGDVYGIANLTTKNIRLYNDLKIKKVLELDSHGRLLFIGVDNCELQGNKTTNKTGVVGLNGIIVPTGKYPNIDLLKNGLMMVSDEQNKLFGILGIDGKELLKMKYSYISAFKNGYASVCIGGHTENEVPYKHIGGKWGVINTKGKFVIKCAHNEEQVLAAEDIIKYNLIDNSEFDSYGRFLFIVGDNFECQGIYKTGVIGLNGIIVPTDKYPNIDLLENGLMMVSDERKEMFGILGVDGKELLKMKYSYISPFKNGYASICIGGHNEDDRTSFLYKHVGGKWGVIDNKGKIIVKCIHDEEQLIVTEDIINNSLTNGNDNTSPKVICSDYIPNVDNNNWGYDYSDNYCNNIDDDIPSVYDNPYYNDNLDMDQQSIDFWNSF